MNPKLLNQYQRNNVTITLRMLEMMLRGFLVELNTSTDGILYRQTAPFSDDERQQIKTLCEKAFATIQSLKTDFALPSEAQNVRSNFQGQLAVSWSNLEEIRSNKLRSYGDVAPGLDRALDPSVSELIEIVNQLMGIL
jgi:hypothetical protein